MVKNNAMASVMKSTKRQLPQDDDTNVEDSSPSKKLKSTKTDNSYEKYHTVLKEKLGVEMPKDFYDFFDLVQDEELATVLSTLGLHLTGPYDILLGNIKEDIDMTPAQLHLHGRHYYDLPEVMTVIYADKSSGFHIGYFRDDPKDLPEVLVSNKSESNGEFSACGNNIFAAVHLFCQTLLKTKDTRVAKAARDLSQKLVTQSKALKYSLDALPPSVKKRQKSISSKTFNKIGLVVPMDKTGVGYRELPNTDRELKQMFTRIVNASTEQQKNNALDELDEIITLIQFANDECDYGMGLELGIDLFAFGSERFHGHLTHLLPLAYQLLQRNLYADVLTAHLEDRKKIGFVSKV